VNQQYFGLLQNLQRKELNEELDLSHEIINSRITLANLRLDKNIRAAAAMGEAILAEMPEEIDKSTKRDLYELLYICYKSQNRYDLSLKMLENYTLYRDSIQEEKNAFAVTREAVKNDFELRLRENKLESEKKQAELKLRHTQKIYSTAFVSVIFIILIILYARNKVLKNIKIRDDLLEKLEEYKNRGNSELLVGTAKFELDQSKIETYISRKLNQTDWKVLNILLDDPVITNKEIAAIAFMSIDGIGSSLRRMYDYFDIKESKYKKISLLMDAIKISNDSK